MKRVLIVEDELSIADYLSEMVHFLGYETKTLTSGRKVLATAKQWKPDLITLDILMPEPDGATVLADLKKDPDTRGIPVIIISAVTDRPDVRAKLALADAIFSKPLDPKPFLETVQKVCESVDLR